MTYAISCLMMPRRACRYADTPLPCLLPLRYAIRYAHVIDDTLMLMPLLITSWFRFFADGAMPAIGTLISPPLVAAAATMSLLLFSPRRYFATFH